MSVFVPFVITSVGFALLPGPNVVFLLARSAQRGPWSAWRSALGVETATVLFALATAAGLGAVIAASSLSVRGAQVGWSDVPVLVGREGAQRATR